MARSQWLWRFFVTLLHYALATSSYSSLQAAACPRNHWDHTEFWPSVPDLGRYTVSVHQKTDGHSLCLPGSPTSLRTEPNSRPGEGPPRLAPITCPLKLSSGATGSKHWAAMLTGRTPVVLQRTPEASKAQRDRGTCPKSHSSFLSRPWHKRRRARASTLVPSSPWHRHWQLLSPK